MPHLPGRPPSDADYPEFVHASWASLYRTAYLVLGDHAEAEDLTQTALAKTYAAWHRVRDLNAAPGYARTSGVPRRPPTGTCSRSTGTRSRSAPRSREPAPRRRSTRAPAV